MLLLHLLHHIVFVFRPVYVFGMVQKYIVCECASCPAYPGTNLRSWRTSPKPGVPDKGPQFCRFCQTPFKIPRPEGRKTGGKGGPGGSGGSAGGTKGKAEISGSSEAADESWFQRNSKGRPRRVQFRVEDEEADEVALEGLLRQRLAEKPTLAGVADDILRECFPKKPKTPKEILNDGMTAVEKARSAQEHLTKVCSQMQASYDRRFEELVQYKANLDEHYAKLESAKAALSAATAELVQLQAANGEPAKPTGELVTQDSVTLERKKLVEVTQAYNPMAGISRVLASLQALEGLNSEQAKQIGDAMSTEFKGQMAHLCEHLAPEPPPPPPPPPPPSSETSAPSVPNIGTQPPAMAPQSGGVGWRSAALQQDTAMVSKNKRGFDELEDEGSAGAMTVTEQPGAGDSAEKAAAYAKDLASRVQAALASHAQAAAGQSPP